MKSADIVFGAALAIGAAAPGYSETPLSAIDWLSDSIRQPPAAAQAAPAGVATNAAPETVSVSQIGGPSADALGLLPASVSGLAPDLWAHSSASSIADRLRSDRSDLLPAMQDLFYLLLLAELEPPADSGAEPELLLARIDTLLALGALDQAAALVEIAGSPAPELFRRAFDISLLLGTEDKTCGILRDTPAISPTFPARIFCLARGGDWAGAALSLDTGRALGYVTEEEDALLVHFLELGLDDADAPLTIPIRPSPLEFRMYEAIGRPLPTTSLPRAFAHTDLHRTSGWKSQIEAAERLARSGAIDANRLLVLYTERKPAASGGVWDRAAAIQALDAALLAGDTVVLSLALEQAWAAMKSVELEMPFARAYCDRLGGRVLGSAANDLRFSICMLSGVRNGRLVPPANPSAQQEFMLALHSGDLPATRPSDPLEAAIHLGLSRTGMPVRLQSLMQENREGEAILRAIDLFVNGASGDFDELADALTFFRAVGLEDTARNGAIQLLLLERMG